MNFLAVRDQQLPGPSPAPGAGDVLVASTEFLQTSGRKHFQVKLKLINVMVGRKREGNRHFFLNASGFLSFMEEEEEVAEEEDGGSSMGEEEDGKLLRKQDYISWHDVMGEFDHLLVRTEMSAKILCYPGKKKKKKKRSQESLILCPHQMSEALEGPLR